MPATSRTPDAGRGVPGTAAAAPGQSWRRVFPGDERQLREMRHWLADLLPRSPALDDVMSVATELASNAVKHTASGRGGSFAVEVSWQRQLGAVWLAVADGGAPEGPHEVDDPQGEHGRGLMLVYGLSARTGTAGDEHSRVVWAEIPWDATQEAYGVPVMPAAGEDAGISEALAELASRFAGIPVWYGRSTQQWWALIRQAGKDDLIAASSAAALAEVLSKMQGAARPFRPVTQRSMGACKAGSGEYRVRRRGPGAALWPGAGSDTPFADATDASGFAAAPVPWDGGSGHLPEGLDRWAS